MAQFDPPPPINPLAQLAPLLSLVQQQRAMEARAAEREQSRIAKQENALLNLMVNDPEAAKNQQLLQAVAPDVPAQRLQVFAGVGESLSRQRKAQERQAKAEGTIQTPQGAPGSLAQLTASAIRTQDPAEMSRSANLIVENLIRGRQPQEAEALGRQLSTQIGAVQAEQRQKMSLARSEIEKQLEITRRKRALKADDPENIVRRREAEILLQIAERGDQSLSPNDRAFLDARARLDPLTAFRRSALRGAIEDIGITPEQAGESGAAEDVTKRFNEDPQMQGATILSVNKDGSLRVRLPDGRTGRYE